MWIPAVNTCVELKRSDYKIPEMSLAIVNRSFEVERVTRQLNPPASRSHYQVSRYDLAEVQDHLFDSRTNQMPMSDSLRIAARKLALDYLYKAHPAPFREDQIFYVAPVSSVCNDVWAFWKPVTKIMLFSPTRISPTLVLSNSARCGWR